MKLILGLLSANSVDGVSVPEEERESYAWLQDKGKQPEEFAVVGELYGGPKIVEH